jgi:hypothetical protein
MNDQSVFLEKLKYIHSKRTTGTSILYHQGIQLILESHVDAISDTDDQMIKME